MLLESLTIPLRTEGPTEIVMLFLSFSDNLLLNVCFIFHRTVDNFEMAHKTCQVLVWVALLLK